MSMFTLAISCLTTSNLPWFTDLAFQVPMQYCSLQHRILLSSLDTSTTETHFLSDKPLHFSDLSFPSWNGNDVPFVTDLRGVGKGGFKVPGRSLGHWDLAGMKFGCVFVCFLLFFLTSIHGLRILVPQTGMEPGPRDWKHLIPNHWTTKEFLFFSSLSLFGFYFYCVVEPLEGFKQGRCHDRISLFFFLLRFI